MKTIQLLKSLENQIPVAPSKPVEPCPPIKPLVNPLENETIIPPSKVWKGIGKGTRPTDNTLPIDGESEQSFANKGEWKSVTFPSLKRQLESGATNDQTKATDLIIEVDRGLLSDLEKIENQISELIQKRNSIAKLAQSPLRIKRDTHLQIAKDARAIAENSIAEIRRITALLGDSFDINN